MLKLSGFVISGNFDVSDNFGDVGRVVLGVVDFIVVSGSVTSISGSISSGIFGISP